MKLLRKSYMLVALPGLLGLMTIVWIVLPKSANIHPDELSKTVLTESWEAVTNLCVTDKDIPVPAHLRALQGHACLALNRNDESLKHFLTIVEMSDRLTWKEWASRFAKDNKQSAVAFYLKGDALARLSEWEESLTCYEYALGMAKSDYLKAMILSARGVVYAQLGDTEKAMFDLEQANIIAPGFADAHANMGTLLLIVEAADGAMAKYDEALQHSDSYTLVQVGKTCAMLGQSRDQDTLTKAFKEFSSLTSCPYVAVLATENLESLVHTIEEAENSEIVVAKGMSLSANEFREMDNLTRTNIMNNMTRNQLDSIITKSYENYAHSRSVGESLDYLGPLRDVVPFLSSEQSHRHADQHLQVFNEAQRVMQEKFNVDTTSYFRDSGGVDTEGLALYKSRGDMGPWPARKTWFGLMPGIELPNVTVVGTELRKL